MKRSIFAVVFWMLLSTLGQAVTWQKINFPDGNGPVAMNDKGDILNNTCYLRSNVDGSFIQINNPYPQDSLTCYGINNAGTVIGTEATTDNTYYGVALPNFGKEKPQKIIYPGSSQTYAMGINNYGTIVGSYNYTDATTGQPTTGGFWLYHGQRPYHQFAVETGLSLYGINDLGTFIGSDANNCDSFIVNANGPIVSYNEAYAHPLSNCEAGNFTITGVNIHGSLVGYYGASEVGDVGVLIENGVPQYFGYSFYVPLAIDKWGNILASNGFVRWVKCTPKVGC
jgi:hypothetical protein